MEAVQERKPMPLPQDLMQKAEDAARPHIVTREINTIIELMLSQANKGRTGCAHQFGINVATTEIIQVKKTMDEHGYYTEITPARGQHEGPWLSISWAGRRGEDASKDNSG